MDATHDSFGQGLIYEDMVPLRWRALNEPHTAVELAHLQDGNEEVLRVIGVLDEHLSEGVEEHAPLSQEMTRIETKLNLLLALLGQLFTLHYPQPPARSVKLTPNGVEWVAAEPAQVDDYGVVELYLSARCPRPLVFPGTMVKADATLAGHALAVKFRDLNDVVKERLEKIIFRHHRRRVALTRRRPPTDTAS